MDEEESSDSEDRSQAIPDRRRVILSFFLVGAAFGFGFLVSAAGFPSRTFFQGATALVTDSLRGVFGSSSSTGRTFEIDLGSSTSPTAKDSTAPSIISGRGAAIPASETVSATTSSDSSASDGDLTGTPSPGPRSNSAGSLPSAASSALNCDFSSGGVPSHGVLINEVAWMGSPQRGSESVAAASNNEWIELRNTSPNAADLSGWHLIDDSEKFDVVLDGATAASGFYLLERTDDDSVPNVRADKIYSGALANAGMWLRLFDANCGLVDELTASSSWPGGDNATKQTLERDIAGFDWHTSVDPGGTPKQENSVPAVQRAAANGVKYTLGVSLQGDGAGSVKSSPAGISCGSDCYEEYLAGTNVVLTASSSADSLFLGWSGACSGTGECKIAMTGALGATASFKSLAPSSASAAPPPAPPSPPANASGVNHLVIAQVQIAGASASNDFIKIYNPAAASADLSGWKLRKRTQAQGESDYYSIRVFPSGSSVAAQGYFVWANSSGGFSESIGADTSSTETLAATSSIAILDSSGVIVDALAWGSGQLSPYIEGSAYPASPPAGQILKRKFVDGSIQDTDDNSEDFTIE